MPRKIKVNKKINLPSVIRVGTFNNFNFTKQEVKEALTYSSKGYLLANTNSFVEVKSDLPSFVTINPYMKLQKIKGNTSNIRAIRVKVWLTKNGLHPSCIKTLEYANTLDLPVLLTFMRFRSKASLLKYKAVDYTWKKNYFRPTMYAKTEMMHQSLNYIKYHNLHMCDRKDKGCPSCLNCSKLGFGIKNAQMKSLNLSISGKKDARGKQGLCKYNCPDCFAKTATYGYSPACDRITKNRKQRGIV